MLAFRLRSSIKSWWTRCEKAIDGHFTTKNTASNGEHGGPKKPILGLFHHRLFITGHMPVVTAAAVSILDGC